MASPGPFCITALTVDPSPSSPSPSRSKLPTISVKVSLDDTSEPPVEMVQHVMINDQNFRDIGKHHLPSMKLTAKAPEHRPSQKETIVFQPAILGANCLPVSFRVPGICTIGILNSILSSDWIGINFPQQALEHWIWGCRRYCRL